MMKRAKISATYRTISPTLQQAEVDEPLPARLTFFLDNRFTATHERRIRSMLSTSFFRWMEHFEARAEGEISEFQTCANKYSRFNLAPVWFEEKIGNGAAAVDIMMNGFTTMFAANGFNRSAKAFIKYEIPKAGQNFTVKATNGSNPETDSLTVTINPKSLDRTDLSNTALTGALWHAWMHRLGYRHPAGLYTSYFIGEFPMCLMRGFRDKVAGEKDSRLFQFLS